MTGETLGPWTLGPEIGRGSFGVVYKSTATAHPERVAAVKVLTHESTIGPEFLRRFPGEMLPLQQLIHPNIARFYDSGVQDGVAYYATEFIDGTDLATLLKSAKRGDPGLGWREMVVSLAAQVTRGLKHGHLRNTLCRDLKPSNVMIAADGCVKLTDFGVTKVLGLLPPNHSVDLYGTEGFLAPEFFTGKLITRRSDLYSLGCVLYAAVTGRPPFTANSFDEYMHKHCYVLPDRPIQFVPKLPPEFDDLICALLQKDPNRRPTSATAVLTVLEHIRGRAERKGEPVVWPGNGTGGANGAVDSTAFELDADVSDTVPSHPPYRPLMSRPWVVIPLFLLVAGVAATLYFWPRPSPEELLARARPLIETNDPEQWERALDEYLTPLSERYPDQFTEEIQAVKTKLQDHRRLRRALAEGARVSPKSEAERLYLRGLAFVQVGDMGAARRVWCGLTKMYAEGAEDRRWVMLATAGIAEIDQRGPVSEDQLSAVTAAVERALLLPNADAEALFELLEQTYQDDPTALKVIRQSRKK
jgi:serine/threonine protein kinase